MAIGRKKFFDVEIPVLKSTINVLAVSPEELPGKIIKYDLTRILRGKNFVATFVIKKEGDKLASEFKSLVLQHSYIAKSMRKGVSYVEDSFVCSSKDAKLRIKPFLLTRKKVHRRIKKAIRNKCRELISDYVKDKNLEEIFGEIIFAKFQKQLAQKLKKVYPLSFCEIRIIKRE